MNKVKKAKSKERNSSEYYRSVIRELEAEVRRLKRQIREQEKTPKQERIREERKKEECCGVCGKGKLNTVTIASRIITTCDLCGERWMKKV